MESEVLEITDINFDEEVLKSPLPVLVDFWAVWCVPCKMIASLVEAIAQEYKDRIKVVKLNVDENMKVPSRYGIRGIPTLLFFKNGELKETIVGALPKDKVVGIITKHI
ncbi:MAG: thioredoxin [Candidatus Aminicenantales bacterium]